MSQKELYQELDSQSVAIRGLDTFDPKDPYPPLVWQHFFRFQTTDSSLLSILEDSSEVFKKLGQNEDMRSLLPHMHDLAIEEDKQARESSKTNKWRLKLMYAALLSQIPEEALPSPVQQKLGSLNKVKYQLSVDHGEWKLCPASEEFMEETTTPVVHGVVLVDDTMLVKAARGKLTGLALYPRAGENGVIVPGMWYSPTGKYFRSKIVDTYNKGETSLTTERPTEWALMRALDPYGSSPRDFLGRMRDYAQSLPAQKPPPFIKYGNELLNRKAYGEKRRENPHA